MLKEFDIAKRSSKFTGNKDISVYKSYGELAKEMEKIKDVDLRSKGEKERAESKEGQKTIYKDDTYEIVELSTPRGSHDFCYSVGGKHWCVKDEGWASNYLKRGSNLYAFLKNGKAYAMFHKASKQIMDFYDNPVDEKVLKELYPMIKEHIGVIMPKIDKQEYSIDELLEKGFDLEEVYEKYGSQFTSEQIDKAIENGEHLSFLYEYVGARFNTEQIDKAIEKPVS